VHDRNRKIEKKKNKGGMRSSRNEKALHTERGKDRRPAKRSEGQKTRGVLIIKVSMLVFLGSGGGWQGDERKAKKATYNEKRTQFQGKNKPMKPPKSYNIITGETKQRLKRWDEVNSLRLNKPRSRERGSPPKKKQQNLPETEETKGNPALSTTPDDRNGKNVGSAMKGDP